MKEGFYEQIITQSLQKQLSALQDEVQQRLPFGKADGPMFLRRFFPGIIQQAFQHIHEYRTDLAKSKSIYLATAPIPILDAKLKQHNITTHPN